MTSHRLQAQVARLVEERGAELWLAIQSTDRPAKYGIPVKVAARMLGCRNDTARLVLQHLLALGGPPERVATIGDRPPTDEGPLYTDEEIVDAQIERYRRRKAADARARMSRRMWLPNDLPVGILHIGDPHLDDDGADLELLRSHLALIRDTPGLYGGCVGDLTNNWVGRLVRLYAEQHATKSDERQLIAWFFRQTPLLYYMAGNHDKWNEGLSYLKAVLRASTAELGREAVVYLGSSELELTVLAPCGESWMLRIRHNFKGHSWLNPTHGLTKDAMLRPGANILVQGHKHNLATASRMMESGDYVTAIQVSAYKRFDTYAQELQFAENEGGEAVMSILNPLGETPQARQLTYTDPFHGALVLGLLRRQAAERLHADGKIDADTFDTVCAESR